MRIWDFFDKIYCINLEERKDRWVLCEEKFEQYNIINYIRFEGIKIKDNLSNKKLGQIGCALSFYRIIKNAYENFYKNILIFEDDFYFVRSKDQTEIILKESISNLPKEWDVLYLGANIVYDYSNCPLSFFNKYLFKLNSAYCTHSISFSRNGINKFINRFANEDIFINEIIEKYEAIDIFMAKEFCFKNSCFITSEMICNQCASFSSIEGYNCDYSNELLKRFEKTKYNIC